jgi:hypothetical protein
VQGEGNIGRRDKAALKGKLSATFLAARYSMEAEAEAPILAQAAAIEDSLQRGLGTKPREAGRVEA